MHVCFDIRKVDFQAYDRPVVTLGSFDGVHLGHQAIINRLMGKSREREKIGVVVTYEPHPQSVVAPQNAPGLLTTMEERLRLLEGLGVEETVVMSFDEELRHYSADEFVERILVEKLNVGSLVVGEDHAFGKDRSGRTDLLERAALTYGFDLEVVPAQSSGGTRISSTRIRKEVVSGDFAKVREMLGHPYPLSGTVTKGKGRGRNLGYPTLNLKIPPGKLLPQDGVYGVRVFLEEREYPGMLYVGPRPTFREEARSVEVHVLGREIEVTHLKVDLLVERWVRKPKRFPDPEHLRDQLKSDEKRIKEMFGMSRSN
ncbi:MAG: bifunctional riboflavin kinase/FAD synthetase [Candidatus Zixiibacteriota bacterium]|nr:MAG: bifunctional riboflavin kinase/FAD synthetase [candidate division Zixibacteria bacterium]